jgi:hypothetical protein
VADEPQAPAPEDEGQGDAPGPGGDGGDALGAGERNLQDGYKDFRQALEALPNAAAFQALVTEYGRQFGFRTVGRWVAGRAPKPPQESRPRSAGDE